MAAAFSGGALAVWVGVQVTMVGYLGLLPPVCFAVGLPVLGLAFAVATRAPWSSRHAGFYLR